MSKKCPIDGTKLNIFNQVTVKDGTICTHCRNKVGLYPFISYYDTIIQTVTVDEVNGLINEHKTFDLKKYFRRIDAEAQAKEEKEQLAKQNLVIEKQQKHKELISKLNDGENEKSGMLIANFKHKLLCVLRPNNPDFDDWVYSFEDFTGYTPIINNEQQQIQHGITRAIAGGLLAGGVGAIVGASTGGKNIQTVNNLAIVINIKNIEPRRITYVNVPVDINNPAYQKAYNLFKQACLILDHVTHDKNDNLNTQQIVDPADEIRKFKKLADDGIITQAEFEAKKKQLLGL